MAHSMRGHRFRCLLHARVGRRTAAHAVLHCAVRHLRRGRNAQCSKSGNSDYFEPVHKITSPIPHLVNFHREAVTG